MMSQRDRYLFDLATHLGNKQPVEAAEAVAKSWDAQAAARGATLEERRGLLDWMCAEFTDLCADLMPALVREGAR